MKYNKTITLKDGRTAVLRNGDASDGAAVYEHFTATHGETDFLLAYPDENSFTLEQEADFLAGKAASDNEIMLLALVDGTVVGTASVMSLGAKYKVKHRADFGISVSKEYWGLGIGKALTKACIQCAKDAGYTQLELSVVADTARAVAVYRALGVRDFGLNPKGFNSRTAGYQELLYMLLEL